MDGRSHAPPLFVLGGSDLSRGALPAGTEQHPLSAYKGAALRVSGRPLVCELAARFRASGAFGETFVAGPRRVYEGLDPELHVVDTDADVATNVRAAMDAFLERHADGPIAVTACDVLPTVEEIAELARLYRSTESALWFPFVRVPEDRAELGAFAWKPKYTFAPEHGEAPVRILPGHLIVADPRALRLPLLYRLLEAAYRTRNRSVGTRKSAMLRSTLSGLVRQDLLHLVSARLPILTWVVVKNGIALARDLRARRLTIAGLEHRVGRILLKARYRKRHPLHGVRLPVVDALSLAEDIDTEEEARDAGATVA